MSDVNKNNQDSFLGTGWSFPPTFLKASKGVKMTSDVEDINKSLEILLSTTLGERLMEPNYGCNLKSFLFEPINQSLRTYLEEMVKTAILYHEARIDLHQVQLDLERTHEGVLLINVGYTVRGTNSRFNLVYPFYIEEGVGVQVK